MTAIEIHRAEIAKVKQQIAETKSPYRKRDLKKYLSKLKKELMTYRHYKEKKDERL